MMPHHQGVELQHHPGTRDGCEAAHHVVEAVAVCQLLFIVVGSKLGKDLHVACVCVCLHVGGRPGRRGSWLGEMKRLQKAVGKKKWHDLIHIRAFHACMLTPAQGLGLPCTHLIHPLDL